MDEIKKLVSTLSKLDRDMFWSEEAEVLIASYTEKKELEARLVELDLLEQAINAGAKNMNVYKLHRLKDLEKRLKNLKEGK